MVAQSYDHMFLINKTTKRSLEIVKRRNLCIQCAFTLAKIFCNKNFKRHEIFSRRLIQFSPLQHWKLVTYSVWDRQCQKIVALHRQDTFNFLSHAFIIFSTLAANKTQFIECLFAFTAASRKTITIISVPNIFENITWLIEILSAKNW